jgi:hypothetical protein
MHIYKILFRQSTGGTNWEKQRTWNCSGLQHCHSGKIYSCK